MKLSDDDRKMLLESVNSKAPGLIQVRMANALLLLADGIPVDDVAGLLYLDEITVAGWKELFVSRQADAVI